MSRFSSSSGSENRPSERASSSGRSSRWGSTESAAPAREPRRPEGERPAFKPGWILPIALLALLCLPLGYMLVSVIGEGPLAGPVRYEVLLEQGKTLSHDGQLDAAMERFEAALALESTSTEVRYQMAKILLERGRFRDCEALMREALRYAPDRSDLHNTLGIALEQLGRDDEAFEHYREAMRLAPDYSPPYLNIANLLEDRGEVAEAITSLETFLRLQPDYHKADEVRADLARLRAPLI